MVSFICDQCQDTVKKPKLDRHRQQCYGASFTCVDCNQYFSGTSYREHVTCISEAEKYQKSLFRGKKGQAGTPNKPAASTPTLAPTPVPAVNGAASTEESKKRKREADAADERATKKSKASATEATQEPETSEEVQSAFELNDLKWRKTIKRALKKAGGRMQQSSLESAVLDTLLQDSALRTRLQQLLRQKIRSSKYSVEGEYVALK